ncbi:unnamed protein product [Symbiodinium pilosum]|uniref:Uncharacterized protein n=1 Tax=Symbiodinium pilosum TaxID=2952 RepID=A0A812YA58_SYMPI|nr:unnamed protein product [Symbiodinium pilosum]
MLFMSGSASLALEPLRGVGRAHVRTQTVPSVATRSCSSGSSPSTPLVLSCAASFLFTGASSAGQSWLFKFAKSRRRAERAAQEDEYWELSDEERARLAEEMDTNAPYRYLLLFLAALLVGKALPDAVFSYLKNLAGIRGAILDPQMLAFDALLCGLGVGLAYAALTLLGPPEIPAPQASTSRARSSPEHEDTA